VYNSEEGEKFRLSRMYSKHGHKSLLSAGTPAPANSVSLDFTTLLHPFNGLFSRTTSVTRHHKGKPFWILLEQEVMGWQCHQLDHMQIICTSLQTDNHASTSSLIQLTHLA